ncbi:exopolysaccharide biosynthesis polyprenyl glycosylphosphotransferase [Parasphingorhabdus pacifica]
MTELADQESGTTVLGGGDVVAGPSPLLRPRSGVLIRRSASTLLLPGTDAAVLLALVGFVGPVGWRTLAYSLAVFGALNIEGQHRLRICLRVSDQVPRIGAAVLVPLVPFVALFPFAGAVALGLWTLGALVVVRGGLNTALRAARSHGLLVEQAVVLGGGTVGTEVARLLDEYPESGLHVRGFVGAGSSTAEHRAPLLGTVGELPAVVSRYDITRVIVCSEGTAEEETVSLLRSCRALAIDVCVVPRLPELGMMVPRGCLDEVRGVPLVPMRRPGPSWDLVKRGFDLVVGGILTIVLAPLLLTLALLLRLCDGCGPLFRQSRISKAGSSVEVVKLRTVPSGTAQDWTVRDEQCSSLGRWLRSTHCDELPQLFSVLRGEMSLVGPRPERPCYAVRFSAEIPGYDDRHRVPGGMTGWAQVHGLHGDTSIRDRARFDNQYIEYWSLWMDVVIVARTGGIVLAATIRSLIGRARAEGKDNDESSARDHRSGGRRGRAATAVDLAAHPARSRRPGAL